MSALSSNHGGGSQTGPFHFTPPQGRIDWAALRDVDVLRVVRETDLDSVEAVLGSIAHGSLQAADPTEATPVAVGKLFAVSQLAVQYFIYVQERLAADVRESKTKLSTSQKEARSLKDTISQLEREVAAAQREARHTRRLLKSMVAPPAPAPPAPAPAAVLPHTVIQHQELKPSTVPAQQDPEAKECLQRLDAGIRELLAWKETAASRDVVAQQQQQQPQQEQPKIEARPPPPPAPEADRASMSNPTEPSPPHPCTIPLYHDANQSYTRSEERTPPPAELLSPPPQAPLRSPVPPVRTQLPSSSSAGPSTPPSPTTSVATPSQMGQFLRERPHEAVGYERPGVISRFPHRLSALRAMRAELQAELAAELAAQLADNGVDPENSQGLTSGQYLNCVDGLRQRRADALGQMGDEDKEREAYMRNTIKCHVEKVTKAAAAVTGGLGAGYQPERRAGASHGHHYHHQQQSYLSPGTAAALASGAYHSPGLVDDGVGEFYSPLRQGSEPSTPHAGF